MSKYKFSKRGSWRKKKSSKGKAQDRHASKRFLSRYDVELTIQLKNYLLKQIFRNESKVIDKQSNRVIIHEVKGFNDEKFQVVYDKHRKNIVTVLPEGSLLE